MDIIVTSPMCKICGKNSVSGKSNRATKCDACRKADPYRNGINGRAMPEIIVQVDTEGDGKGNITSASFGREDGTSGSIISNDAVEIIKWWMDNLSCTYEGKKQVVGAFHFNYDTAVLTRFTDQRLGKLELIYKVGTEQRNQFCSENEFMPVDNVKVRHCKLPHRFSKPDIRNVITTGGEGDIIAWDSVSKLAIAATPRRRFYVEERPSGFDWSGKRRILDVHDQGTAFVGGLEAVIDKWQPEISTEQRDVIAWGKQARKINFITDAVKAMELLEKLGEVDSKNRDKINAALKWGEAKINSGLTVDDLIAQYSEAECVAAAKSVRLLITTIEKAAEIKIKANSLFGSGSLATAAFKKHNLTTLDETHTVPVSKISPKTMADVSVEWLPWMTYFGGMIETPVVGLVPEKIDEEDLNSAYPAAMVNLPCMRQDHGKWKTRQRNFDPKKLRITHDTVGHVLVTWDVNTISTPPFMVRGENGSVYQPLTGYEVWVTMPEYLTAVKRFGSRIVFHKAVWWEQTCDCGKPFVWMRDLYNKRLDIKNQMKTVEKNSPEWQILNTYQEAIKLVLNSCYGKLCQRRPILGKYTNLHYGSHITGATRAKLRELTWKREDKGGIVVYQHTDAVLSVNGGAVDGGKELGAWGLEDKETINALIMQPGLMTSEVGKTATRGVASIDFKKATKGWLKTQDLNSHPTTWLPMAIPTRRMISRRMAQARNKPELAGQFFEKDLVVQVSKFKRNLEQATPVKTMPGVWQVPPVQFVSKTATLDDVLKLHKQLIEDEKAGRGDSTDEISGVSDFDSDYADFDEDYDEYYEGA